MFEDRDAKSDIFALGLLVLVAFLAFALVSYNPADPPVELVYPLSTVYQMDAAVHPTNETCRNICGPWGSLAAAMLLDALGLGAYYAVASLGVVTTLLLMRREVDSPIARTIGWLCTLVAFSTLCAMLIPSWTPGPIIGSGGYLGALVSTVLHLHFAKIGGLLLAASLLMAGLLMCTDYVLVHLGLFLGTLTLAGVMGMRRGIDEEEDEYDEEIDDEDEADDERVEQEETLAIRVGGRRLGLAASADEEEDEDVETDEGDEEEDEFEYDEAVAEDEDEYDDEEDYEDEEDEEELPVTVPNNKQAPPAPAVVARRGSRRRLSALRVRRPPEPEDRDEVMNRLDEASEREDDSDYELPEMELLIPSDDFSYDEQAKEVRRKAKILEKTFQSFGYDVKVVEIETGPVIAQYEVELESGLRLSKITGLADDVAIALRVPSVRIVAPIPGKNTVGIEVPNEERQLVRLRDVMAESNPKLKSMRIPIFLGKDVSGNALTVDLSSLPHLLIAGRTGTGKSVCLNAIITSILMTRRPDEVRMLMIDPKMVELSGYKSLPHLMHPVVTDMRKAEAILAWAVEKMEERYSLLAQAGVRHLSGYNQLGREELLNRIQPDSEEMEKAIPTHMPYIVIVADEIADMMMTAGKDVEQHIIRLAQKSRAVGIHLILATQKPTVDVITGLIKSNLPARVSFQVASRTDSRVVLDEMGAEKLLGNGDMLFLWPGTSTLLRGQGTFVSDDEINGVVEACSTGEQHFVKELVHLKVEDEAAAHSPASLKKRDDLYEKAIEIVVQEGRGSVSLLQRALGIGYGRAARLIDFMAEDGIVGPYAGSQAREVLMSMADVQRLSSDGDAPAPPVEAADPPAELKKRFKKNQKNKDKAKTTKEQSASGVEEMAPADVEVDSNAGTASPPQTNEPKQLEHSSDVTDDEEVSAETDEGAETLDNEAAEEDDGIQQSATSGDDEMDEEYEYEYEYLEDEYDEDPDGEYEYEEEDYEDEEYEYAGDLEDSGEEYEAESA